MNINTCHHGMPRARVDPISDECTALKMIKLAMTEPQRNETIVVLLDDARRGLSVVVVSGTDDNQAVLEVIDCITESANRHEELDGVIIASVRTGTSLDSHNWAVLGAAEDADIDRWFEMSHLAEEAGIELVEWFIIGRGITCPRDLIGAAPRW
ncbi:MAG TPA: hypothetical protein VMM60_12640 [Ilumatobacter sp.]|nr:hypothetical protein [Ilumatobacter sp.]